VAALEWVQRILLSSSFRTYCVQLVYVSLPTLNKPWASAIVLAKVGNKVQRARKMDELIKYVEDQYVERKDMPDFSAGDTVTVYYQIREGAKVRTQFFKGVVLQRRGSAATETFTIRKMSGGVGVERIFPVNNPSIEKIELNRKGSVRRARIFYQRGLTGKAARIKEKRM